MKNKDLAIYMHEHQATCEHEGCRNTATNFCLESRTGNYRALCDTHEHMYRIEFGTFFVSNEEILDWSEHMHSKYWFNGQTFIQCLERFAEKAELTARGTELLNYAMQVMLKKPSADPRWLEG
jgi:hypothetical protein